MCDCEFLSERNPWKIAANLSKGIVISSKLDFNWFIHFEKSYKKFDKMIITVFDLLQN